MVDVPKVDPPKTQDAALPEGLTNVKFGGKNVDLGSVENLKAMAQKGMLLERGQQSLADQRKALDAERATHASQLKTLEEIERLKRHNPKAYEAMNMIFRGELDPEQALALQHTNGDADPTRPVPATSGSREIEDLRTELSELKKVVGETRGAVYQRTLNERIDAAIDTYPELKSPKAREFAKAQIAAAVGTGSYDPETAAAMVSTDIQGLLAEKNQAERDRLASQQSLGTISPNMGTPVFPTPPKLDLKPGMSIKDKVALATKSALEALATRARGAASGPGSS